MGIVIDASVVVKWFVDDSQQEPNHDMAIRLLVTIGTGKIKVTQPLHWLAEVAGVLVRIAPDRACEAFVLLDALELSINDSSEVMQQALRLAVTLNHHLFDTLYHAVALETGNELITADQRYYRKAHQLGHIRLLASGFDDLA